MNTTENQPIKIAVVTGQHPFDVPAFHAVLKSMPDVDFYPQHLEDFVSDAGNTRDFYDVIVFYNHHQQTPGHENNWWDNKTRESLMKIGQTSQGILLLHHAIVAYKDWNFWSKLVGIEKRQMEYSHGETLHVKIEKAHPTTQGLNDFEMIDETYSLPNERPNSEILLTTDHPKSTRALAWTHKFGQAQVLCFQSGHDSETFENPNFRQFLHNSIRWLASQKN